MKQIWMYWESSGLPKPKHISLCIDSVRRNAGSAKVILLDQVSIEEYLPDIRPEWFDLKRIAHKADYIRTRLVHKYGGMWLDCDMVALGNLEPLFKIPEEYDYACQIIASSIGCFVARPGCKLLTKVIKAQDRVISEDSDFDWGAIGNDLLRHYGADYPHYRWPKCTLDQIAGAKTSKLLSWQETFDSNVSPNAVIFHLCNEDLVPLIKLYAREDRLLTSHMLISQIFRKAFGISEKDGRQPLYLDYIDAVARKLRNYMPQNSLWIRK